MTEKAVYEQISRRLDGVEDDVTLLRGRSHEFGNKLNQHESVLESQGDVMEGLIERQDRFLKRLNKAEDITVPLGKIKENWKSYLFTFIIFAILGGCFGWLGSDVHRSTQIIWSIVGKFL